MGGNWHLKIKAEKKFENKNPEFSIKNQIHVISD